MASLNKVMLIGNIGREPQRAALTTGQQCAKLDLATSRKYKNKAGEAQELTEWHKIQIWGKLAEIFFSLNVRSGQSIYVEGELHHKQWDDAKGARHYMTVITCSAFQLLGKKSDAQAASPSPAYAHTPATANAPQDAPGYNPEDDDLPF